MTKRRFAAEPRKFWTAADDAELQQLYRTIPARELAERLGRTLLSVYNRAKLLGQARALSSKEGFDDFVREQHALGLSDREVAAIWSARYPDCLPVDRHTVEFVRRRLGLPHNALSEHRREQVRKKTREQLAAAGLSSLGALRVKAFRDFARRQGWPDDLRPRAVQILNALWEQGPMTRQQIAAAVGMPWKGSRKSLVSNDPEGSYLAHLKARGLVIVLPRANVVHGQGKGKSTHIYSLPLDTQRQLSSPQVPEASREKTETDQRAGGRQRTPAVDGNDATGRRRRRLVRGRG